MRGFSLSLLVYLVAISVFGAEEIAVDANGNVTPFKLQGGPIASVCKVFNVREYGATGNGITDDAPAIKSALDALTASTSSDKRIYFPAGTYLVASNQARASYPA